MTFSNFSSKFNAEALAQTQSRVRGFAAKMAKAASSEDAKLSYIAVACVGLYLGVHAAQVAITKKIMLG